MYTEYMTNIEWPETWVSFVLSLFISSVSICCIFFYIVLEMVFIGRFMSFKLDYSILLLLTVEIYFTSSHSLIYIQYIFRNIDLISYLFFLPRLSIYR